MTFLYIFLGAIIYLGLVIDILKTTLSMHGGGWLTSRFSQSFWNIMLAISGRNGKSKLLANAGFFLLISIIVLWVSLLTLSLFLLLQSDIDSIINSSKIPASAWEKLYYAGFVLSTLGIGDYTASTDLWRMVTNLYAFTGLILITMSVTYFVPVLSAIIKQRKLAINLSSLGNSPQEIIINAWDGSNYSFFKLQLLNFCDALLEHNQNHKAYPIIHFFHNNVKDHSVIVQIARLNEAICILDNLVVPEFTIPAQELSSIKTALNNYIKVLKDVSNIESKKEPPNLALMHLLEERNMVPSNVHEIKLSQDIQNNRAMFLALIEEDGWSWLDVSS